MMADLSPGDYIYQSDQELFLVVLGEDDDTYTFAAHGWRQIDKERIDEYIKDTHSKVHSSDTIEELVSKDGDEKTRQQFNKLKQLFAVYEKADVPNDGAHTDFTIK